MGRKYTREEKMQVRDALARLHRQSGLSAGAFAQRVGFTNPSILSQFNTAIDLIGEKAMETALAYIKKHEYVGVVTDNYAKVFRAMEAAYRLKNVQVIIGEGGYGKSFAIERYRDEKEREGVKVYVVNLEGVRTKKGFVRTVAEAVGVKLPYHRTVIKDLIGAVREALLRRDAMLVIDEASALEGRKVTIIKDLMTALRGVCGLVFAGTPYFMANISRYAAKGAHLFSELADRLPLLIVELSRPTDEEAEAIFRANGCDDAEVETLMGRAGDRYAWLCWRRKPTYRGIADAIDLVKTSATVPAMDKKRLAPLL